MRIPEGAVDPTKVDREILIYESEGFSTYWNPASFVFTFVSPEGAYRITALAVEKSVDIKAMLSGVAPDWVYPMAKDAQQNLWRYYEKQRV